jgi:hypothetical protein
MTSDWNSSMVALLVIGSIRCSTVRYRVNPWGTSPTFAS